MEHWTDEPQPDSLRLNRNVRLPMMKGRRKSYDAYHQFMSMKVFISCDMEGISGITSPDETNPEKHVYERSRRLMTGDCNAAVEGVLLAGSGGSAHQ